MLKAVTPGYENMAAFFPGFGGVLTVKSYNKPDSVSMIAVGIVCRNPGSSVSAHSCCQMLLLISTTLFVFFAAAAWARFIPADFFRYCGF